MLKHARRATLALTTSALLATTVAVGPVANAAPSDVTPQAASAANWLADQLGKNSLVHDQYADWETGEPVRYIDYGLTLDFFFAFDALRVKRGVRQDILDGIEPRVEKYLAPYGTTYAGAAGKLLHAVQEQGIDPMTYDDGGLLDRLEALVHTADDSELGRAEDSPSNDETDSSNTLGQSFVVQALAEADSELTDEALTFLLKQQCSEGFFRVYMNSSDNTCDTGKATEQSAPSVDATAAAVLALLEVRGGEGVDQVALDQALVDARRWLLAKQAQNGSFRDGGVANANSTGLAAQALDALGRERPAARAAGWLASLQVTGKLVRRTAFVASDRGAVALSKAALREGKQKGIPSDARYQWRRATAQSAVALDTLTS